MSSPGYRLATGPWPSNRRIARGAGGPHAPSWANWVESDLEAVRAVAEHA
ncbi:hypothetical protein [Nonomuraea insulae]|uniref:Uncharacterized protein n=1 Tax=Nonomuraea insulae TaxID=1616787 RepID=A0ABW1D0T7_9ACTN